MVAEKAEGSKTTLAGTGEQALKECSRCREQKPRSEFYKKKRAWDGVQAYCKICVCERMREYRTRPGVRVKMRGYDANWYAKPENRERARATKKIYYQENKDLVLARDKEYRARNAEKIAAYERSRAGSETRRLKAAEFRKRHHQKVLSWNAARYAKTRSLPSEKVDRLDVYDRDGGICHICHKKVRRDKFHLDHLIPVKHGGGYLAVNLRVAHPRCNMARGPGRIPAQLLLVG